MPLIDQRMMSGHAIHSSPAEVEDFWRAHAEDQRVKNGYMFAERRDATDFERSALPLHAYVNHGRWVADCPRCNGGVALWQEHDQGCCLDCGTIYNRITWPSQKDIAMVEKALSLQPIYEERNWNPKVEKAKQLVARVTTSLPPSFEDQVRSELGDLQLSNKDIARVLDAAAKAMRGE
jgi:hypothetical protein